MGIQGLLNLLNPITVKEHISTFQGQTAAIDIMSWIYKGCYRCAYDHNLNIESNNFLYYILEMLQLLAYYRIKPICVFDGRYISKKDETIQKRRKAKEQNRQKGLQCLSQGNQELARKYLSRCIIIDDRIISLIICALYTKGIEYMIAPYQSDSQVAKLVHLGLADFAITEDSDLIVYNARVVLKLTQDGECDFIDVSKWNKNQVDSLYLKQYLDMDFINRTQCAILAGSDYNSSIKGIGIKKAIKYLTQCKTINAVIEHLRQKKSFSEKIVQNYESIVLESKLIFVFATIYNPLSKQLQFLNQNLLNLVKPQDLSIEQLKSIVGPFYEYNESVKVGKINNRTFQPRNVQKIDIKSVFSVNYGNLTIRESANQKRRELQRQQKQRREQEMRLMAESGQAPVIIEKRPSKKQPAIVIQLSEQQKKKQSEQRKADKIRRFSQFKEMLNNLVMEYSSQSENSEESSEDEVRIQKTTSNKKNNKTNESTAQKNNQNKDEDEDELVDEQSQQSISVDLQLLNPWSKNQ